jgi:hypothetical protein
VTGRGLPGDLEQLAHHLEVAQLGVPETGNEQNVVDDPDEAQDVGDLPERRRVEENVVDLLEDLLQRALQRVRDAVQGLEVRIGCRRQDLETLGAGRRLLSGGERIGGFEGPAERHSRPDAQPLTDIRLAQIGVDDQNPRA